MKHIYLALALIAFFLEALKSATTFATTKEEGTVAHLESASAKWQIEVLEDNFYFSKGDQTALKKDVLGFFEQAGTPTCTRLRHYSVYLYIVIIFSVFGYVRECNAEKGRKRPE